MIIAETGRRICATFLQQVAKPGRQLITFLLFANITLWILDIFIQMSKIFKVMLLKSRNAFSCWPGLAACWKCVAQIWRPVSPIMLPEKRFFAQTMWVKDFPVLFTQILPIHFLYFFRDDYCRDWPKNLCHTFAASCQTWSTTDYIPAFCKHHFVDFGHVYDPQLGDTRNSTGVFWTFGLGCHFSHKFATDDLL